MIKVVVKLSFALIFSVTFASADPIIVRSGDHDGFTRLVMPLPENVQWQVIETRGLKTIVLSGHDSGFDTRRVFDIIPQDQLTEVRAYPSRLELELTCDCDLSTFVERNGFLVVDIIDGPPLPPLEVQQAPQFTSAQPGSRFNYGDLLWSDFPSAENQLADTTVEATVSEKSEGIDPTVEERLVQQTRERLLFGIGNAASRGILDLVTSDLQIFEPGDSILTQQEIFDSSEKGVTEISRTDGNIRITNSRDIPKQGKDKDSMTSGALCADPNTVDVSSWGTNEPFAMQVSNLREKLFSEIDSLDDLRAKELAQLYLYFGFGAEAKQILRMSDTLVRSNPALMDLADIMEYGFARNPRFVHRFSDCNSDLALWSILAAKTLPVHQLLDTNAALLSLAKLPKHLQAFLAPALSARFSEIGELEAALVALRNVQLGEADQRSQTEVAQAKIEAKVGNVESAHKLLSNIAKGNFAETPEALIAYVDNHLSEKKSVPADIALLVETYAFQMRSSTLAKELARAHVIASSYSDQFSKAFDSIKDEVIVSDPVLRAELTSYTFSALAANADDIVFLEAFYEHFPESSRELMPATVFETSQRLLHLGFTADALAVLSTVPEGSKTASMRLLQAEVLLELGEAKNSIAVLDGIEGSKADYLRASAMLRLGENASAFELFQATDKPEEAAHSAWLADEWDTIVPIETPVLGQIISLADQEIPEIEPVDGMLALTNATLDQSTIDRERLQALLKEFTVSQW